MCSTMAEELPSQMSGACTTPVSLVFICGFPGSGTDLLKNILDAHDEIVITGEFPLLPRAAKYYGCNIPAEHQDQFAACVRKLDINDSLLNGNSQLPCWNQPLVSSAAIYAHLLSPRRARWKGNKTPQNTQAIRELGQVLFPESRFILIVRDPRDVALSWHRKWGKDMLWCAHKWNIRMLHGLDQIQKLDRNRALVVRYEDLLAELEKTSRRICAFLELPFSPRMLNYHLHVRDAGVGKTNHGMPIMPSCAGRWRHGLTQEALKRIEEIAFEGMLHFNYKPLLAVESKPLCRSEYARGVARDLEAMLLVGNRAHPRNSITYRLREVAYQSHKRILNMLVPR